MDEQVIQRQPVRSRRGDLSTTRIAVKSSWTLIEAKEHTKLREMPDSGAGAARG